MFVYRSTGTGFDLASPWFSEAGWQIGYVNLHVGNFDGDTDDDILMVNTNHAFVYQSNGTTFVDGGWWDPNKSIYKTKATLPSTLTGAPA